MISVTRQKPFDDILEPAKKNERFFIAGCGTCATELQTGGISQVNEMKEKLQEAGYLVMGTIVIPTACDEMNAKSARENETAIKDSTSVLVMACAMGVHRLNLYIDKPVLPVLDTMFMGQENSPGYIEEACNQCGQCILGYTAGICPVANCHKGLLNGPCGGTNGGKCEIDNDKDCAFTLIYNKLKEEDRLDLIKKYHPPKNNQLVPKPRVTKILLEKGTD